MSTYLKVPQKDVTEKQSINATAKESNEQIFVILTKMTPILSYSEKVMIWFRPFKHEHALISLSIAFSIRKLDINKLYFYVFKYIIKLGNIISIISFVNRRLNKNPNAQWYLFPCRHSPLSGLQLTCTYGLECWQLTRKFWCWDNLFKRPPLSPLLRRTILTLPLHAWDSLMCWDTKPLTCSQTQFLIYLGPIMVIFY